MNVNVVGARLVPFNCVPKLFTVDGVTGVAPPDSLSQGPHETLPWIIPPRLPFLREIPATGGGLGWSAVGGGEADGNELEVRANVETRTGREVGPLVLFFYFEALLRTIFDEGMIVTKRVFV